MKLAEKNQKLLSELTSLGQVKRTYESRRSALVLCFLILVVVNVFFTLEWWMHLLVFIITGLTAFVCYRSYLTLQKVNLREKYNIGKRAHDDIHHISSQSMEPTAAPTTARSSSKQAVPMTTKSPLGPSPLRNRLNAVPGRNLDYQQQIERENYDLDAPSRLLEGNKAVTSEPVVEAAPRPTSAFSAFTYGPVSSTPGTTESPAHLKYHLSPLTTGPKPTIANTFRTIDALQALQLPQIRDEWVERLREILGRDLIKIVTLFDESVAEILTVLRRANVPNDDLKKIQDLLEFRSAEGKETLPSNNGVVTLDDVLKFAQHVGTRVEILQQFDQTSTFMKLCQWLVEVRQQYTSMSAASIATSAMSMLSTSSMFPSSSASTSNSSKQNMKKRLTPMIDRLRDMARESRDVGLNIHWINQNMHDILMTGRIEHEIFDQEVVMALFLKRCDSFAHLRSTASLQTSTLEKFSKSHYAVGMLDVRQRLRPVLLNAANTNPVQNSESLPCILLQRLPSDADVLKESGLMGSLNAALNSLSTTGSSASAMKPPHFDILRMSTQGQYYEELYSIDTSRQDIFESIIVFMLIILTSQPYSPFGDESSAEEFSAKGGKDGEEDEEEVNLSSLGGSFDYRVIKQLLEGIITKEELKEMWCRVSLNVAISSSSSIVMNTSASYNGGLVGSSGKTASPHHHISPSAYHQRLSLPSSNLYSDSNSAKRVSFSSSSTPGRPGLGSSSSVKKIPLHSSMFGGSSSAGGATPSSSFKTQHRGSNLDQSFQQGHMSRLYSNIGSPQ